MPYKFSELFKGISKNLSIYKIHDRKCRKYVVAFSKFRVFRGPLKTYGLNEIKLHFGFVDVAFTPSAGDQEMA